MSEPKRYGIVADYKAPWAKMHEYSSGEWVRWEDYARLKAEVERLRASSFVTAVPSEVYERSVEQYNSIIDQHLAENARLKAEVEHIDMYKSVVEKFFNSADLKNTIDAQSHCAIMEKLKQLPDCILDFTEEQVRDNPAWALAVFRHKVKDMQYKRVHDLNAIGGEQEENARLKAEVERLRKAAVTGGYNLSEYIRMANSETLEFDNGDIFAEMTLPERIKYIVESHARLKAEVERLRKAGDAMAEEYRKMCKGEYCEGWFHRLFAGDENFKITHLDAWNAAKDGKPTE